MGKPIAEHVAVEVSPMRRGVSDTDMLAPMMVAMLMLGTSLLYNSQWLAMLAALLLYVVTLAMLYMRRPHSWDTDGEQAPSGEVCAECEVPDQFRASFKSIEDRIDQIHVQTEITGARNAI